MQHKHRLVVIESPYAGNTDMNLRYLRRIVERCSSIFTERGRQYASFKKIGSLGVGRVMALHKLLPATDAEVAEARERGAKP